MNRRHSSLLSIVALSLLLVPSALSAGAKVVGPPEVAWKDLTFAQKKAYMKAAVMPKMKTVFQPFDEKKFKKFTCETCHGKGATARKFKMPSPDIHPLPGTPQAFEAKMKEEPTWPKWTKFMAEEVEPSMAKLLDRPPYDPKNPVENAFGCNGCHKIEGQEGKQEGKQDGKKAD